MKLRDLSTTFKLTPDANGTKSVKTAVFRASWVFVFEPRETPNGEMKYQICMIFPKNKPEELKPMVQAILNTAAAKFGSDMNKWPVNLKNPLRDGDEERDNEEYKGAYFVNAGTKNPPGIVDRSLNPIMDRKEFYSGCYARASVNFYGYDTNGNKGVGTGLNNLLKWADGEPLSGAAVSADKDFAEFATADDGDGDDVAF